MVVRDRVCVVTGAGAGIGQALCRRFAAEGAAGIVVSDVRGEAARTVAEDVGGLAVPCDVSHEEEIRALVGAALDRYGRIDLFCSNAGVTVSGGEEVPDDEWQRLWQINLMAHVYAARAVLPHMLERGAGCLLQVASAAGVLTEIGSAPYSVTKHATVAFAEWLSVHYQKRGIQVSCVCPAGVDTGFLDLADPVHQFLHMSSVTPEQVSASVVEGLAAGQFLILPHPEVEEFFTFKAQNYDRWLKNFARVNEKIEKQIARQERRE